MEATDGDSLSPSYAQRVFPFDMATGIQIDSCNEFSNRQKCAPGEAYPGLWQIPLWQMTVLGGPYNLDPAE